MDVERLLLTVAVVVGVPAATVGYITLAEALVGLLPYRRQPLFRPWVWLAPGLALLLVFLVYPSLNTLYISFFNHNSTQMIGLDNYVHMLTDQSMLVALRNNALWLVAFTVGTVTLGLVLAILTDRVRYEGAVKAVIFLPMAVSFVAASVIWKFMYAFQPAGIDQTGTLNAALTALLPGFEPQAWLVNIPFNNMALILVAVWTWTGFCLIILSAALKGIPAEILEAARVDGASEWQVFRSIIVPMLGPTIAVVATTMIIFSLKAFDIVYVMTNGNFDTEVIANRMYKEMFNFRHFGRASAIATVLLVATIPVMLLNIRRLREQEQIR